MTTPTPRGKEEKRVKPIPLPDLSGPKNRNLRRRVRYHVKKTQDEINAISGVPLALLREKGN